MAHVGIPRKCDEAISIRRVLDRARAVAAGGGRAAVRGEEGKLDSLLAQCEKTKAKLEKVA